MDGSAAEPVLARVPFWFLRHGETDWNARNLSQGNIDIPLNANGIAQAQAAAALLRGRGIASIVASPLSRARDTAAIAGAALGLPVAVDDGLREVAFGVQEGQPMADWFAEWISGALTPEGAESFAALRRRAVSAVNRATAHPPAVLVVAHGALFRALRAGMGLEPNVRTRNGVPFWCAPGPVGGAWALTPAEAGAALTM
ncbi:MAG: histidine phosphatase family protein [Rhodospirillales bacterium]|jgi:probable phosphoglycerate mutase|nr:histidine phosphatase family protein [Rhodospirillales bacterium]